VPVLSGGGAEIEIYGGVGGAVCRDDSVTDEPDGETRGDDGVGWHGQIIYKNCPYIGII
jgi:hypothetical protein